MGSRNFLWVEVFLRTSPDHEISEDSGLYQIRYPVKNVSHNSVFIFNSYNFTNLNALGL